MESDETKLALINQIISEIVKDAKDFITRVEFNSRVTPLERIVYGMVSLILVSVFGALIALVIRK